MLTEKYLRKQIRKQLLRLVLEAQKEVRSEEKETTVENEGDEESGDAKEKLTDASCPAVPVPPVPTGSDCALKENVALVATSPSGINVYEFDYKDKSYGEGRYRGVMAQEVPWASFRHESGYLWVDYAKVDVKFERIS